jgi:hypothetical protein
LISVSAFCDSRCRICAIRAFATPSSISVPRYTIRSESSWLYTSMTRSPRGWETTTLGIVYVLIARSSR